MSKEGLEALLARTDVWLLIFGVFVAIGVAGESFFGIRHWWNSRLLRKLSDAEAKAKDKEIASLRLQVEESRRTNLEMQRRIQPREIAAELMPALLVDLAKHAGQKFEIMASASDAEGAVFASRIRDMLVKAGWTPKGDIQFGALLNMLVGVDIRVSDSPATMEAGEGFREALRKAHIAANVRRVVPAENAPKDIVAITVGVKPIPEMGNATPSME